MNDSTPTIGSRSATVEFNRSTPVYFLGPNIQPDRWLGKRCWLLLPVIAHRVMLAESREGGLNLFQRVVLDLCRVGVRSVAEIASRSGLGVPLTEMVVEELKSMTVIDAALVPTILGERELDQAADDDRPTIPGQVFMDPRTGTVLPRVALGELPGASEWKWLSSQHGQFRAGSAGRPEYGRAQCVFTGRVAAPRPRPHRALEALRLHRQAWFSFVDRNRVVDRSREPMRAARIVVTKAPPTAAYILTFAYVPQDALVEHGWAVADPFGLGRSDGAVRTVRREASRPDLERALEELQASAAERGAGEAHAAQLNRRAEAERAVRARLGVPEFVPSNWKRVLACTFNAEFEDRARAQHAGDFEGNVASTVGLAFEELFATLLDAWSAPEKTGLKDDDVEGNARKLTDLAARIGFAIPEGQERLRFLRIRDGKLWWALKRERRGLVPLLALNLMEAERDGGHPLRTLARDWPEALQFLQQLHEARNPESHGEGKSSATVAIGACDGLYRALEILGNVLGFARAGVGRIDATGGAVDTVQRRIRIEAIAAVEKRYGEQLEQYPALRDRLRRMEYRLAWLRDAEKDAAAWAIVQPSSIELLREAAPAVELAVSELLKSGERLSRRREWATDLASLVQSLGFPIDPGGALDAIMSAKREAVLGAAEQCVGALGALAQALLRSAALDPDHPLRAIALRRPRWLESIAWIARTRGHADRPLESVEDCEQVADRVHEIVKDALDALSGELQFMAEFRVDNHDDQYQSRV